MNKFLVFLLLVSAIVLFNWYVYVIAEPSISESVALQQMDSENTTAMDELNALSYLKNYLGIASFVFVMWTAWFWFRKEIRGIMRNVKGVVGFFVLCCLVLFVSGCKKYDTPEYIEIGSNESAFLVPMEGDTGQQAKFNSIEYLDNLQVATKRIRITHRWNKTGRLWFDGEWIGRDRLIKVDRAPVTREWTADNKTGTEAKDQAIWAESKDSVGFSTGISITAMIHENDASKFLYLYPTSSLCQVLDTEARSRVQLAMSDFGAKYGMSDLRDKKNEMMLAIREDLRGFYKDRGITITTIAQFGGFTYENPAIQTSIDNVFVAEREKEVAKAMLNAQNDKNKRIELEATVKAEAERRVAQGIADGKASILAVAKSAASDPTFLELQRLEVERARIEKWDGKYPMYMITGDKQGGMILGLPVSPSQK